MEVKTSDSELTEKPDSKGSGDWSVSTPPDFPMPEDMSAMFSIGDGQMVSLRDIMSIVYQCRFCGFSADTSVAVTTHVVSTHLARHVQADCVNISDTHAVNKENESQTDVPSSIVVENVDDDTAAAAEGALQWNAESDTAANNGVEESKEVFLCGQCRVVFDSIDGCKQHMVDEHAIPFSDMAMQPAPPSDHPYTCKVSVATQSAIHKKPGRKRKAAKDNTEPNDQGEETFSVGEDESFESLIIVEPFRSSSRRQIRPPKALREDYYLGQQKVRQHRSSNVTPAPQQTPTLKCSHGGCTARFITDDSQQLHLQCHVSDGNGDKFRCAICTTSFSQWRPLHMHLWKEHGHDMDLPRCSVCDFRADSAHKVATHAEIHSDVRPYTCNVCGKSFKQQSQMCNHFAIHRTDDGATGDGGQKRWYASRQCDICQRNFANQKCLRKHIEAVHSKLKPFVCRFCGYATSRKAMLQLHVRTHTGEKPFKCDICLYATGDHNTLRRHRMRHTGRKPYSCAHCSYTCIQAISLKSHLQSKHPGLRGSNMHACTRCAYQTVNEQSYLAHVRDHDRGLLPTLVTEQQQKEQQQPVITQGTADTWYATLIPEGDAAAVGAAEGTATVQIFAGSSDVVVDAERAPDVYANVLQEIYASGMVATLVPDGGAGEQPEGAVPQEGLGEQLLCAVPQNGVVEQMACNVLQVTVGQQADVGGVQIQEGMEEQPGGVVQIQGGLEEQPGGGSGELQVGMCEQAAAIVKQEVVGNALETNVAEVCDISEEQSGGNTTKDDNNTSVTDSLTGITTM